MYELAEEKELDSDTKEALESMKPIQLLTFLREKQRKKRLGSDETYEWLQELPDYNNMKVLRTKYEFDDEWLQEKLPVYNNMKVLKTKYEIDDAGQRLHKCALSYSDKVRDKKCILILYDSSNTKDMALGEYSMSNQIWAQIRGPCNCVPSKEVIAKFKEYNKSIIQLWFYAIRRQKNIEKIII